MCEEEPFERRDEGRGQSTDAENYSTCQACGGWGWMVGWLLERLIGWLVGWLGGGGEGWRIDWWGS